MLGRNSILWLLLFGRSSFAITTTAISSTKMLQSYSTTIATTGGTASYTWSITAGSLPTGLILHTGTGVIDGIATVAGTFTITLRVVDGNGLIATRTFNLIVSAVRVSGIIEMEFNGKGNGWTIINDVMMKDGITFHRGLPGIRVTDRVADISTLRFKLNNSERSAGGLGYYSPDHVNKRSGFNLNIGVRYRIGSVIRFTGILDAIDPMPGLQGPRTVSCEAVGWFAIAQRTRLNNLPVLQNKRGDEVFQTLINSLSPISRPLAVEIDQSPDIFPYTLDRTRDEQTLLRDEILRNNMSDFSLTWERGDGTVVYESRSRRSAASSDIDTFTDSHGFMASRNRNSVINKAQVTIHPRDPGQFDVLLYTLKVITPLNPGEALVINGPWTDPANRDRRVGAVSLEPIIAGVDYLVNTLENGTGVDLTNLVTVTRGLSGNSSDFTIQLMGNTPGFITLLQQRGRPLYDYGPSVLAWEDEASIEQYGEVPVNIDQPYGADPRLGLELCQYIVYTNSQPNTQITAPFKRFIAMDNATELVRSINRDISDRIKIADPLTGISRSFFIQSIDETELETTLTTQWTLQFADSTAFWLLEVVGRGELGINTRLGFGLILGHTDIAHIDSHVDNAHNDYAHSDTHTDNAHLDMAHGDGATHGDTVHSDTAHADASHADAHTDSAHNDSPHTDVRYQNSHSDNPHADVPHDDIIHSDTPHADGTAHNDGILFNGSHGDANIHTDSAHIDSPHADTHIDTAHADVHNDSAFQDEAHEDFAHGDVTHADTDHGDTTHLDVPHSDAVGHADSPAVNSPHGDVAHADTLHNDDAHGDKHADRAHGDIN